VPKTTLKAKHRVTLFSLENTNLGVANEDLVADDHLPRVWLIGTSPPSRELTVQGIADQLVITARIRAALVLSPSCGTSLYFCLAAQAQVRQERCRNFTTVSVNEECLLNFWCRPFSFCTYLGGGSCGKPQRT